MTPSLARLPQGCSFGPRCPRVEADCRAAQPGITEGGDGRRWRCLHPIAETLVPA